MIQNIISIIFAIIIAILGFVYIQLTMQLLVRVYSKFKNDNNTNTTIHNNNTSNNQTVNMDATF